MKGIIFCDFLDMVQQVFSPEMVEHIIEESNLPSKGAYTDIGTYDHEELIRLVTNLSKATKMPIPDLEIAYGKYLFKTLLNRYFEIVKHIDTTFEFLRHVDQHVHIEVLKFYPEAELPRFECSMLAPHKMTMKYSSNHPFSDLAEGLILGCGEYFKESIMLERKKLIPEQGKKFVVLFTIIKQE